MRSNSLALVAFFLSAATPTLAAVPKSPHDRLFALFQASNEGDLKRNPLTALFRGDLRYADRLGDYFTDTHEAAERAADEADLKALHAIPRAGLNPTDRIAYDVFEWRITNDLDAYRDPVVAQAIRVEPINHFDGLQLLYPDVASGQGAAPFKTLADYDNNLKRHADYVRALDQAIVRFRQGIRAGIVESKLTVRNMIDQFDGQIAQGVERSTFYQPVETFPDTIPEADRARLRTTYAAMIRDRIIPADRRMRDFLKAEYLPAAREGQGLKFQKGGDRLYAYLIKANTTLPISAAEVHALGLKEVARIRAGLDEQRRIVGFTGSLAEFFTYMRTDPRFQPKSAAEMRDSFLAIQARVEPRLREQFATFPKSSLEIRPVPAFSEKTAAGGSYNGGTPDGSRPGVFYYNSYDLPSRLTWEYETLFLHEGEPGHHFQISLAQENAALPSFMRFGGNTAFVEGWALYAESLGPELGMETDPWQRAGALNDEMLRAMRLVVDTGIHAYGWTREQSIQYFLDNSPESVTDATAEVERYIAIPGQALAYKIGQLTIQRCKAKALAALGPKFDPRAFHAQILMTGALPMAVLERKIDDWIAAQKAG